MKLHFASYTPDTPNMGWDGEPDMIDAKNVIPAKEGRAVLTHLTAAPLREVYERWAGTFEGHWAEALVANSGIAQAAPLSC